MVISSPAWLMILFKRFSTGLTALLHSDYALFFAYIQTEPKERTALWAGAKELAEVNGQLFLNFLEGMKAAGIKPKRVLLQTGGKV